MTRRNLAIFLALVVALQFGWPLATLGTVATLLYMPLWAAMLLVGVSIARSEHHALWPYLLLGAVFTAGGIGVGVGGGDVAFVAMYGAAALFQGALISVLLRRILDRATGDGVVLILAAVCVYLLLGGLFVALYGLAETVSPGSVVDGGADEVGWEQLIYFSYVTLATLGYGDVLPRRGVDPLARDAADRDRDAVPRHRDRPARRAVQRRRHRIDGHDVDGHDVDGHDVDGHDVDGHRLERRRVEHHRFERHRREGLRVSQLLAPVSVHRDRPMGTHVPVGPIELFFDLVYVFIIIQLSHFLLEHLDVEGVAQTLVLFAAVWWAWNYSAWAMNWLDPDSPRVRALLCVLMLLALGMGVSLPYAFADRAALFVGCYLAMQLLRSGYMVLAFRNYDATMQRNYEQLLTWSVLAAVPWVLGVTVDGNARLALWFAAVVIDYLAPRVGFTVPGRGATPMQSWSLRPEHLAERNELVLIISLGETILILGGVLSDLEEPTLGSFAATVLGFGLLVMLWWTYFDRHLPESPGDHSRAAEAGRTAFAYAHAAMVGGAIVVAVAIELVVAHPEGHADVPTALTAFGGPSLFLLGNITARRAQAGEQQTTRWLAMGALVVAGGLVLVLRDRIAPLVALALPVAVLTALAISDHRAVASAATTGTSAHA